MIHIAPNYSFDPYDDLKRNFALHDNGKPLIFLAGPIQGTWDWQEEVINYFNLNAPWLDVASPRRQIKSMPEDFTEEMYNEQVEWEHHHLYHASENGVVLFWLAKQTVVIPGRDYAQTTRFELGEASVSAKKLFVGIEKGFSGEKYIRKTLGKKRKDGIIFDDLKKLCEHVQYA